MASSLQTLVKILQLEKQREYENKAVIGGFARFAYHWSREAHAQAQTDGHHALVEKITSLLREYDGATRDRRIGITEEIITLASGTADESPAPVPVKPPAAEPPAPVLPIIRDTPAEAVPAVAPPPAPVPEPPRAVVSVPTARAPRITSDEKIPVRQRRASHRPSFRGSSDEAIAFLQSLGRPVTDAPGVGPSRAELLARLDVTTIADLLSFFPRRYDDYSRMRLIQDLMPGEEATVVGVVTSVATKKTKSGREIVEALLTDKSASLRLSFFNQPWMARQLGDEKAFVVSGKVDQYLGRLVMNSPELEPVERESLHAGRVVPIYPLTEGLSARQMRRLMKDAIDSQLRQYPDYLPLPVREANDLMDLDDAISQAHFPDTWQDMEDAHYRLTFDQLFQLHIAMLAHRRDWQSIPGYPVIVTPEWLDSFHASLPFTMTAAQRRAGDEILHDIALDRPMNRLLQGDVGSGKTILAALFVSVAIANGLQAAIMAPTSILAEQHFSRLESQLTKGPLGPDIRVALLTGKTSASEKEAIYAGLADGSIACVIGTHALIQEGVTFDRLGAVVIDEQHRFGTAQRGLLRDKAGDHNPHLLVMTATPIPRTLALTLHADLDLTVMDELPPGRQVIETRVLQPKERERAYAFIRSQVEAGRQAYIIYPLVEESDRVDARAATAEYERLGRDVFPDLSLGLLHGRMTAAEKDAVMEAFYHGDIQVLISTTVIEVGIDVPNATVMMVEDANRFGLAQLHQLRGRVGRGEHASYCLLVSDREFLDVAENERLAIMEKTDDGFKLAEMDWKLRGAGDLLGTRQSGLGPLHFIESINPKMLEQVQLIARDMITSDPDLAAPEHRVLQFLIKSFQQVGDIS